MRIAICLTALLTGTLVNANPAHKFGKGPIKAGTKEKPRHPPTSEECLSGKMDVDLSWQFGPSKKQKSGDCYAYSGLAGIESAIARLGHQKIEFSEEFATCSFLSTENELQVSTRLSSGAPNVVDGGDPEELVRFILDSPSHLVRKFAVQDESYFRAAQQAAKILWRRIGEGKKGAEKLLIARGRLSQSDIAKCFNNAGCDAQLEGLGLDGLLRTLRVENLKIKNTRFRIGKLEDTLDMVTAQAYDKVMKERAAIIRILGQDCPKDMEKILSTDQERSELFENEEAFFQKQKEIRAPHVENCAKLVEKKRGTMSADEWAKFIHQEADSLSAALWQVFSEPKQISPSFIAECSQKSADLQKEILKRLCSSVPVAVAFPLQGVLFGDANGKMRHFFSPAPTAESYHGAVVQGVKTINGVRHWVLRNSWGEKLPHLVVPVDESCRFAQAFTVTSSKEI